MSDAELVEAYVADRSETAFGALVEKYLPLVYAAALRQVSDRALAEDVTQVVFVILARKASTLSKEVLLPGWFFRTTHYVAAKALRTEQRRHHREQEALRMQNPQSEDVWAQVAPYLDEALAQLGEIERGAVLLHYFQNKRLREVGQALGLSEDAAQKRITRAVERLRRFLAKHGVALPGVALPGLLMSHGVLPAPAYLSSQITAAALTKTALSISVYALLQEGLTESPWPKIGLTLTRVTVRLAALAVITFSAVYLWPKPSKPAPSAPTFDSRVIMQHAAPAASFETLQWALLTPEAGATQAFPVLVSADKPRTTPLPAAKSPAMTNPPSVLPAAQAPASQVAQAKLNPANAPSEVPWATSGGGPFVGWPQYRYTSPSQPFPWQTGMFQPIFYANPSTWAPVQRQSSILIRGSGNTPGPARKRMN